MAHHFERDSMNEAQEEIKKLIEQCMGYAKSIGLMHYRKQFIEIWDTATGRFLDRKSQQIAWLKTLNQTVVITRLIELLETSEFPKLGPESIFMGEFINV
jgi:hypothetical protein